MSEPILLCIDSSVSSASVALAKGNILLGKKVCVEQKQHASFLQPAIKELLNESTISINDLSAIAVTNGPGSYTGLRVSMATVKGLCYALNIPLITLGSLDVMAFAAKEHLQSTDCLCPLIDARRMEVFTALYNKELKTLLAPQAMILTEHSFAEILTEKKITFFGNGAAKWQQLCTNENAVFETVDWDAASMISPVLNAFIKKEFSSLAYATPFYLKEFHFAKGK